MIAALCLGASARRSSRRRRAQRAAGSAGLPLQDRRRADQRHGDGHRCATAASSPACARKTSGSSRTARSSRSRTSTASACRSASGSSSTRAAAWRARSGCRRRQALNRFLFQLLDRDDEVFLYRFDNQPELVEGWTTDRERIATGLARIRPRGATSLYDAVAAAVPLAQTGRHRKKAIVVISDGNDTNSRATIREVKTMIRSTRSAGLRDRHRHAGMTRRRGAVSRRTPTYPPPQGRGCRSRCRFRCPGARSAAARSRRRLSADASPPTGSSTSRGRR